MRHIGLFAFGLVACFIFFDFCRQRPETFQEDPWRGCIALLAVSMAAGIPYFAYYAGASFRQGLLASAVNLALILGGFAVVHAEAGILCAGAFCQGVESSLSHNGFTADVVLLHDLSSGLYFATVTFTTLGYGDLQPHPALQLLASSLAIAGYLHLATLIGMVLHWFDRNGRPDKRPS